MPWNLGRAARKDPSLLTIRDVYEEARIARAQTAGMLAQQNTILTSLDQLRATMDRALDALPKEAP